MRVTARRTVVLCAVAVASALALAGLVVTTRTPTLPTVAAVIRPGPAHDGAPPGFSPPRAGTYRLERIMTVPDGAVLDSDGSAHRLRDFTAGKLTVFSLVYTYCADAKGCPLAYATLHALRTMLAMDPALRGQVRFVSMSFDPAFDTPPMMRSYGGDDAVAADATPWYFLTTASTRQLVPILAGFGQDASVLATGTEGERVPVLGHLLKVYLIDRSGSVREIYTTTYLHPVVIRNDLATLLMEERALAQRPGAGSRGRLVATGER